MKIDADGILKVETKRLHDGEIKTIVIRPDAYQGLTDEMIETMRQNADFTRKNIGGRDEPSKKV